MTVLFCPFYTREPLNKSAAALGGSFAATFRFKNLEIHKVFLRFFNLNLRQNLSPTALADLFRGSLESSSRWREVFQQYHQKRWVGTCCGIWIALIWRNSFQRQILHCSERTICYRHLAFRNMHSWQRQQYVLRKKAEENGIFFVLFSPRGSLKASSLQIMRK